MCAAVRRRIIVGQYSPGERLTEDALAEEYKVSRIPVREALRVLASEGFVRVRPYYGTFVAELSAGDADDLLEVRAALEPLAARLAAERRTPEQLAELRRIVAEGSEATKERRYDDVAVLNGRFHEVLGAASGNANLRGFIRELRDKIDWVYSADVRRRARDSWGEHIGIVDAIDRRDAATAARLVLEHIEKAATAHRRSGTEA
ncbi:MAG TPA: GntR family transcriptional regulator [Acidimicrobiales bacterium]|nr:GntR family transcriptional regulator [Acidimicrobiales bacterium]